MAITDTGGFVAKDYTGEIWSVKDIQEQAQDILKHQDYGAMLSLVRNTRNWRKLKKNLLVEMLEMLGSPKPRGRKRLHDSRKELKAIACLVKADQAGLSFSKVWESFSDGPRPRKPKIDIEKARSTLSNRDEFDGDQKQYLIRKFQIAL